MNRFFRISIRAHLRKYCNIVCCSTSVAFGRHSLVYSIKLHRTTPRRSPSTFIICVRARAFNYIFASRLPRDRYIYIYIYIVSDFQYSEKTLSGPSLQNGNNVLISIINLFFSILFFYHFSSSGNLYFHGKIFLKNNVKRSVFICVVIFRAIFGVFS